MGESITLQRRNLKVEVQLSSFDTFAVFEKHIKSKFDLDDGVRDLRDESQRSGLDCMRLLRIEYRQMVDPRERWWPSF